jgi:hypothetical protein
MLLSIAEEEKISQIAPQNLQHIAVSLPSTRLSRIPQANSSSQDFSDLTITN